MPALPGLVSFVVIIFQIYFAPIMFRRPHKYNEIYLDGHSGIIS